MKDGQDVTVADVVPDPELLKARAQARQALEEITEARSIGAEAGYEALEERVVTLFFECRMEGYPGWRWAATLTRVDEESPVNVLEVELLPGEGAVIAPDWVPWSERLAQFRESQAQQAANEATDETAAAKKAAAELSAEDDAEDDLLDNDFSDFDDELDGVDIDSEDGDDGDDEFDDDDSDDDDDESDDDDSDDESDDDEDDDE